MSGAGPTGVEAAKVVAEYIRLRSTLDEDDAANIIHILHEAGVRFRLPSSDGASETDALARENQWRKLEGRDPSPLKPAPDAMREACAKIADSYTAPNRFKVSDQWKDDMSPAQVYETAAIDVSIAISKEIRDISAPAPPPDGAAEPIQRDYERFSRLADEPLASIPAGTVMRLDGRTTTELMAERLRTLPPPDDVRSLIVEAIDLLAERKHGNPARSPGHNARLALEAALRSAPVSEPDLNRAALAETIHKARFSADRVATSFAEEHGLGREYCFRIADSVLTFINSVAPAVGVTQETIARLIDPEAFDEKIAWVLRVDRHDIALAKSDAILALRSPAPDATVSEPLQSRVLPWLLECFGPTIPYDKTERNHRFLEEALELVQACGCTQDEAHQLVDYVYGRDQGDINQEVGGVMITLAALCIANGFDMHTAGEIELARIWTKVEQIRAKQAAKPKHSPLPFSSSPQHVGREATVSGPAAWQALPYATPQELIAAFKGGGKFVLHYHGKTFDVTHMEAREHIVYVRPPGLPVKVWPDGSSAEGEGRGIWLAAATVSARDAVIEAATEWFNGLEPDFLLNQKTRHAAFDELIRSLQGAKP